MSTLIGFVLGFVLGATFFAVIGWNPLLGIVVGLAVAMLAS